MLQIDQIRDWTINQNCTVLSPFKLRGIWLSFLGLKGARRRTLDCLQGILGGEAVLGPVQLVHVQHWDVVLVLSVGIHANQSATQGSPGKWPHLVPIFLFVFVRNVHRKERVRGLSIALFEHILHLHTAAQLIKVAPMR